MRFSHEARRCSEQDAAGGSPSPTLAPLEQSPRTALPKAGTICQCADQETAPLAVPPPVYRSPRWRSFPCGLTAETTQRQGRTGLQEDGARSASIVSLSCARRGLDGVVGSTGLHGKRIYQRYKQYV